MGQYINLTNALNAVRDIPTAFHAIKKNTYRENRSYNLDFGK